MRVQITSFTRLKIEMLNNRSVVFEKLLCSNSGHRIHFLSSFFSSADGAEDTTE